MGWIPVELFYPSSFKEMSFIILVFLSVYSIIMVLLLSSHCARILTMVLNLSCEFLHVQEFLQINTHQHICRSTHINTYDDGIAHVKSKPYYSQGNGHAKATNKILLHILTKWSTKNLKHRFIFSLLSYGHVEPRSIFQLKPRLSLWSIGPRPWFLSR